MSDAGLIAARWRDASPRLTFLPAAEAGTALFLLLLFSNALIAPLIADPNDPDGGAVLRLVWPPVYLVTLLLIAASPMKVWRMALRAWPVLVLAALTLISAAWSLDPGITMRRSIAVVFTALFGLWLAARFSWRDLIRLIALMFAVLAAGSLIAGGLFPGFGVMDEIHVGAWKGLWWEKNTLGAMMAWASLSFCAAAAAAPDRRERWIWFGCLGLGILLVVLSTSKTALLAAFIAVAGPVGIALARRGFGYAAVAIFLLILGLGTLLGVLLIGPGVILEALGRDATLTGRTDIWSVLVGKISERPMTGYGYGVFWEVEEGPAFWVRQQTAWPVPTAHNAWLETALAIGLPGTGFAFLLVVSGLVRAALRLFSGLSAYWALPFLTSWLVVSLSESNLLEQNGLVWLLVSMTLAKLLADRAR